MDRFSEVDRSPTNAREEIRCIAFHPGAECLYSISTKTFSVHQWEPYERLEVIPMAWTSPTALGFNKDDLLVACVSGPQLSLYSISVKNFKPFAPEEEPNLPVKLESKIESIPSAPVQVQMRPQPVQKSTSPLKRGGAKSNARRSFAEKKEKDSILKIDENANKSAYPARSPVENNYSAVFHPNKTSNIHIHIIHLHMFHYFIN